MKLRFILALMPVLAFQIFAAEPVPYPQIKSEAEKLHAEGSYAKAHELYSRALAMANLDTNELRWVTFRHADTQWRAQFATQTADTTRIDEAREQLEKLVRDVKRQEEKDRVWVEVQESLADFHWTRRNHNVWGEAWPRYQQALDWWAGARDIELARERYLAMIRKMARPAGMPRHYYYGYHGNFIPLDVLENTLKIAQTENDKAHAHYLIAMTLRNQGELDQRARVPGEFEAALKAGKGSDWYDDALFQYAEWMMNHGRFVPLADGNWTQQPDFVRALELYRRLVAEFTEGESRYWRQAEQRIKNITEPRVSVSVAHIFLPDSEIQYALNWRNVKQIELALYPVELNRDVQLTDPERRRHDWLHSIDPGGLEKIKSWTHETGDKGIYQPGGMALRLEEKLKPGAYMLEAKSGGQSARELILVTDAALVLKASGKQALVYFCNALDSRPLDGAAVKLWERWHDGQRWHSREQTKQSGSDGVALFELATREGRHLELFASAILKDRQAFSVGNSYWNRTDSERWKIYAYTDRPAYRPKETVEWKFTARRHNGSVYSTPSEQVIEFQIDDPRGAKIKDDKVTLNAFGSAWGSLELTEQMPLGEYRVTFWDEGRKNQIGNATLFRLEEYKLPEFKVSVQTPEIDGRRKAFRLGETVEVDIQADYYFGGPVANASVEVVVYQNPFYHSWRPPREFPWFYEDIDSRHGRFGRWYGGHGQIIKRETLKTDATGKASLTFETPRGGNQDFEYRIEARVTDASRREIIGNGTVRVTRQRYYVYAQAAHNLYRPQDKVRVDFKALDANEHPVQTEGSVKVTRDYWYEIWIAPDGREVKGEELKRAQAQSRIWPPLPPKPDRPGWRLKFRGYERDEILTRTLKTDTNGVAELTFTPEREGYYRIAWTSEPGSRSTNDVSRIPEIPVRAETTVWVANNATTELGYRHGGVEIIADKDTFRLGNEAPVMLVTPTADRYVLFTVEGEELYSYRLVHVTGTVKLIDLFIEEKHVPNIFLGASLVHDRQFFVDTKQIVVPPTKNFLTVDVQADRPQYQPREEGTFTITTKNDDGKPVSAEVAFGLVDESVYYIQSDYAGDPRRFYFGVKRSHAIQTQATMNQKRYAKLVEGEKEQLIDERDLEMQAAAGGIDADKKKSELADGRAFGLFETAADSLSVTAARTRGLAGAIPESAAMPAPVMLGAEMKTVERLGEAAPREQEPAVEVRTDFRSTIIWQPDVITDENGTATVKVKYPDSLTGWKATARAATQGNQFGIDGATTRTKQPLIVRLQAPRFFVVGDKVTISAVINNNTDEALTVRPDIEFGGVLSRTRLDPAASVTVPANGDSRADWVLTITEAGATRIKVSARGGKFADAMEREYPIYEHGIEKFIAKSGKARGNDITVKLDLPRERKTDSTSLVVQVTPSLAVTMLDALPYLIDYPYGCTEQTMSRFLPAAITAKTLRDLGLHAEDVMGRVFGGIETNTATATHPKGKRDLAELDAITKAGLERLYDFQRSDGGWGWWKEGDSDRWMTAYVVWGLSLARDAKLNIKEDVLRRGVEFLDRRLVEEEENPDMQAWMLHAMSVYYAAFLDQLTSVFPQNASDNLWKRRDQLNAYTRALFALSAHYRGEADRAKTLIANLENGVKRDERPDTSILIDPKPTTQNPQPAVLGTAHWGEDGIYWRWSEGGVEATAFALRALLTIDPKNKLIEPVTNWLIKNRRGAQWSSTRDTAIVVLAMNDYLRISGELEADIEYELLVNGTSIAQRKISGADVFNAPSRFTIEPKWINDANEIRIVRKRGDTPVYFSAEATFFSLEEPIAPAGNEIFVKREYYKLVGRPTLLKGYVYDKESLCDGETVKSGERVETVIVIEAKNNYEYLVFEDLKPAGFEAVQIRSGERLYAREMKSGAVERKFGEQGQGTSAAQPQATRAARRAVAARPAPMPVEQTDFTGRSRWVHQELRDRKVALFIDKLPEGVWEIRYDLRAEVPGEFHALPVVGHAMYVPEIRCNGAEIRVNVQDAD